MQQLPVSFVFEKKLSHRNHTIIVRVRRFLQKVSCLFENAKPAFSNSSGLKSVYQKAPFS